MKKWTLVISSLVLTLWLGKAMAYDNKVTHRDLTTLAIQHSSLLIENYLSKELGNHFQEGIETVILKKTVDTWIQKGSDFEDEGPEDSNTCRASNHFHNPIKGWQGGSILEWDYAQMTDGALSWPGRKVDGHCDDFGWLPETRKSNLVWATEFLEPVADGARRIILDKQSWSWRFARQHFYDALTLSDSDTREIAFSNAFRAIGQVVHLIQDSAQPAHVRNDFQSHLVLTHIGIEKPISWFGSPYENYVKNNPQLVTLAQPVHPSIENPSLTDFWDTNSYNGSTQLSSLNMGLTEYTNANYFSEQTIPNNVTSLWQLNRTGEIREHLFPYPTMNNDDYETCTIEVSADEFKTFVARKSRGGCDARDHMAQISLLNTEANIGVPNIPDYNLTKAYMTMDNDVYETYAKELLPLAIGYSSALIDYFFRGRLGVIKKHNGLVVKNKSDEDMSAFTDDSGQFVGKIEVLYDRADGSRHLLTEYNLNQALAAGEKTPLIPFTSPVDNITPDRYIVVFKGKLGKEEGAVMAKVVSPKIYYVAQEDIDGQFLRKIMRMEADGQHKTVIFNNTDPDFEIAKIAISPDASTLAFGASLANGNASIYTLDIEKGWNETPKIISDGYWPDWSPDGSKLVFQKGVDSLNGSTRARISSYDIKTGTETQLAGGSNRSDAQPAWSPDQDRIAYITNADDEVPNFVPGAGEIECGNNDRSIEFMNASGVHSGSGTVCLKKYHFASDNSSVTSYGAKVSSIQQPVWRPDGNEIMYTGTFKFENPNYIENVNFRYINVKSQPFKINVNTQEETALFKIDAQDNFHYISKFSWSLDGKTIAITRSDQYGEDPTTLSRSKIVLIDADTEDDVHARDLTPMGRFYPDFGY